MSDGREAGLGFLTVHSKVVRRLDALLAASHGMTLNEYEVLLKLEIAGGSQRMSDLAKNAWTAIDQALPDVPDERRAFRARRHRGGANVHP